MEKGLPMNGVDGESSIHVWENAEKSTQVSKPRPHPPTSCYCLRNYLWSMSVAIVAQCWRHAATPAIIYSHPVPLTYNTYIPTQPHPRHYIPTRPHPPLCIYSHPAPPMLIYIPTSHTHTHVYILTQPHPRRDIVLSGHYYVYIPTQPY